MAEKDKIMDKIVDNVGKDYDYFTKMKYRKKSKESPDLDSQKAYDEAEQEAVEKVRKKYGFNKGGPVCKLAKKGKGRAYGKNS